MGLEIERKYLTKDDSWKNSVYKSFDIKQGYLSSVVERVVRIRVKGDKGFLTIKSEVKTMTRLEYEYEIPLEEAEEMLALCEKPIIEKVRHLVKIDNHIWEVDVFDGENAGLTVAEIELDDEGEAFVLPKWVGTEVTADIRYYNSNLIKKPFKTWT